MNTAVDLNHDELDQTMVSIIQRIATGSRLLVSVLFHCRGEVDEFVPHALDACTEAIQSAKTGELRVALYIVYGMAIKYNTTMAVSYMEEKGITGNSIV